MASADHSAPLSRRCMSTTYGSPVGLPWVSSTDRWFQELDCASDGRTEPVLRVNLPCCSMVDIEFDTLLIFSTCMEKPVDPHPDRPVSYTHLRAHETPEHLVCRLLL